MTEKFAAAWLEMREPVDHRSRAADLLPTLRAWWAKRGAASVLDLGSGTGSNLRYLAPRLPGHQRWTLLDHDPDLLARADAPGPEVTVRSLQGDIVDAGLAEVRRADLVTASALLDLVSESWLTALVDAAVDAGSGALFALTYDGAMEWTGSRDSLDALVRNAVNDHQRRDKGLGAALGPAAARTAEALFRRRGYRTWLSPSPWRLGPAESALVRALVSGWAAAASEQRPDGADEIRRWRERRLGTTTGDFGLVVGHLDLLALPEGPASEPS